jgi:AMMECR1 domain-containing protein
MDVAYIMEKKVNKLHAKKEKEEAMKEDNFITWERSPTGMYSVRWANGGVLPNELKTKFTSMNKILAICNQRGIKVKD